MPQLFESLRIRGVTLHNRIGVAPMCQYSAGPDGRATDWHLVHLGSRAVGGAGLIIAEATAVEPRGRISLSDLGLWEDSQIEPLAKIVRFVESQGAVAGIQLAHAGRKAGTAPPWQGSQPLSDDAGGWDVVGASPLRFSDAHRLPSALSDSGLAEVREAFRAAAVRARSAGFRLLELHAAHGYLLHSFLSPLSNQRGDSYGGSFENRIRFLLETVREVREVWPSDRILAVRLSCTDWLEGGWSLDETVQLARRLEREGVDLIDCSSGGTSTRAAVPVAPGYQVEFAAAVKAGTGLVTAAVGLITEPAQAEQIVRDGRADLVLLGRELLRDPQWPLAAALALGAKAPVPPQYARAF